MKAVLYALGGLLVSVIGVALYGWQQRKRGAADEAARNALQAGQDRATAVREAADKGEDAEVQKALQEAAERARNVTGLVALILAGVTSVTGVTWAAEKPDCVTRPAFCPAGYVCLPTACAAEDAAQLYLLTAQVEAFKTKAGKPKHLHLLGLTCGPAASLSVDAGDTTLAGTLSCAVGFTFTP